MWLKQIGDLNFLISNELYYILSEIGARKYLPQQLKQTWILSFEKPKFALTVFALCMHHEEWESPAHPKNQIMLNIEVEQLFFILFKGCLWFHSRQ